MKDCHKSVRRFHKSSRELQTNVEAGATNVKEIDARIFTNCGNPEEYFTRSDRCITKLGNPEGFFTDRYHPEEYPTDPRGFLITHDRHECFFLSLTGSSQILTTLKDSTQNVEGLFTNTDHPEGLVTDPEGFIYNIGNP